MKLIIVESPTKARTLARFLGKDFSVEATTGHIKDLPKSTLGVDIENNFKPLFEAVSKRAGTIKVIQAAAKKADKIYLATDPDREGEAIASHVKDVLANSKFEARNTKRIVFHEITKEAVEDAIAHPRDIDINLVNAQIARRVLDRLVGYKLSPLLWRKVRRGLSAGRVQTVTVRLIVEREREIEAFKPEEFWEIYAIVKNSREVGTDSSRVFTVQLISTKGGSASGRKQEIKNKKTADKVISDLNNSLYKVLDVKKREVRKNPYPPFITSTMAQAAARIFAWSAKRTMSVAQRLYEEGLITYHRTDSTHIAQPALEKARDFIGKQFGANYLPQKPRFYKTKSKSAQEAHEAVRPTDVNLKFENWLRFHRRNSKFSNDERRLYELVWKRFIACQMSASIYDETVIDVEALRLILSGSTSLTVERFAQGKPITYLLRASGQIMKFDGWRKLLPIAASSEVVLLPDVKKDDPLQLIKVLPEQKFTQPPPRYNEASLIKTLEKLGIGRPSTYAPIISTIQIRNYVEKDEGKFSPTLVGVAVNDFLVGNFADVFEYQFTAGMEENLDEIANGKVKWEQSISSFWKPFEKKLDEVGKKSKRVKIETEKLGRACPECKRGELVIRIGRFGKFISCSNFPDCRYTEKLIEKTGVKCPDCTSAGSVPIGEVIVKKSGKGRRFFGCSRYPECKWASWRKPSSN